MKRFILPAILGIMLAITACETNSGSSGELQNNNDGTYVSDTVNANGRSMTLPDTVTVSGLDGDNSALMAAMDPAALAEYSTCITDCSQNAADISDQEQLECMMNCLRVSGFISEGAFSVAITLKNNGSLNEIVTIHAGTVLQPGSGDYQPMMLIQDIELVLAPGAEETFMLPVYCLAPDKSAPDAGNSYTISGLTTSSCLLSILEILETKDIENFSFEHTGIVQDSIWHCVENQYSQEDTDALNALP